MSPSPHLTTATLLAEKAGEVIRKNFTSNMKKEWKDERSPVTQTDLAVNGMILKELQGRYPDHGIMTEEADEVPGKNEYVWICDPVDGTHNFSHGIPTATFALALLKDGEPVLGVIHDPFLNRMWTAEKGKGAFLNGVPVNVSASSSLKSTVIGMGKMKKICNLFPAMEEGYGHGVSFITGLSTHYMSALVASGEFAASFFGGTSPHDIAASAIIVKEAGGTVTDLNGKVPERYDREMNGQLVSNGALHGELLSLLKSGLV